MILCSARPSLAAMLLVPLAVACTPDRPPSELGVPPPPTVGTAPVSPSPTASPTPSQQELSAQAETAYRTASEELERLMLAGGATEASPTLRSVTAELALSKFAAVLKDQKERGYTVSGRARTHTKPAPGTTSRDYDPRLTIQVCNDRSSMSWTEDGQEVQGYAVSGWAYGRVIEGKVMITDVVTEKVERCDLS